MRSFSLAIDPCGKRVLHGLDGRCLFVYYGRDDDARFYRCLTATFIASILTNSGPVH